MFYLKNYIVNIALFSLVYLIYFAYGKYLYKKTKDFVKEGKFVSDKAIANK